MQVHSLKELKHILGGREIHDLKRFFLVDLAILILAFLVLSLTPKGNRAVGKDSHLLFGIKGPECGIPIREWLYVAFTLRCVRSMLGLFKIIMIDGDYHQCKFIYDKVHGALGWTAMAAWITFGVYL